MLQIQILYPPNICMQHYPSPVSQKWTYTEDLSYTPRMYCTASIIYLFFKEKLWRREQLVCVSELHESLFSAGFSDDASDGKAASSLSDFPEFLLLWDRQLCVIQERTMSITHIWVNSFKKTHTHARTHITTVNNPNAFWSCTLMKHPTLIFIPARAAKNVNTPILKVYFILYKQLCIWNM